MLYCRQVLFQWDPQIDADTYQLQVTSTQGEEINFDNLLVEKYPDTHARIVRRGMNFGSHYAWRIRGITNVGDSLDWDVVRRFSIVDVPDSVRSAFEPTVYEPDLMQPGVTVSTNFGDTWAISNNGSLLWFVAGIHFDTDGQWDVGQLPSGKFVSIHRRGARIFNLDNDTLWVSQDYNIPLGLHHEVFPTCDGKFFAIVANHQWVQIEEDSIRWSGVRIIEFNLDGELLWSWNCWDYLSTLDYDVSDYAEVAPGGRFDWLHANACTFDAADSSIYLSLRNISRILKIDYPSGDIIWSMGMEMPSGDVDFGWELEFYRQHAPEPLPNGNLLLYDNHWIEDSQWSRAIEIAFDFDQTPPARIVWEFRHEPSLTRGDADRLPNGNTLITTGASGTIIEVDSDSTIVWRINPTYEVPASYRADRIASLYPLVFTLESPADSSLIPSLNTYVPFDIHNVGEVRQTYHYQLSDSREWLDGRMGEVEIAPGRMGIIASGGFVPQVDEWDEVTFIVWPLVAPEMAETLMVSLYPGDIGDQDRVNLPGFEMYPNYPNPFNQYTTVKVIAVKPVRLNTVIYDLRGRTVYEFPSRRISAGSTLIGWDGKDMYSKVVPAGSYILEATGEITTRRQIMHFLP